jgi:6-phosphogluconolactonase
VKPSNLEVFPDRESLIRAAAEHIVQVAGEAIAANEKFSIALSGGSTPRPLYALLVTEPFSKRIDWFRVHVFWGDERCVPPDDPQSNYRMTKETLLDVVPIPASNIHRIRGEDEPERAASGYVQELRTFFGDRARFDLVLLGMGDDGHTASLFPGTAAVTEHKRWVVAQYVEKLALWRITLTPVALNVARNVIFLVSGAEKADRLKQVLQGLRQPEILPAQAIQPVSGRLLWFVDQAAASKFDLR